MELQKDIDDMLFKFVEGVEYAELETLANDILDRAQN